jgi:hypothetical protein
MRVIWNSLEPSAQFRLMKWLDVMVWAAVFDRSVYSIGYNMGSPFAEGGSIWSLARATGALQSAMFNFGEATMIIGKHGLQTK